jgi:protein tyrosine/serine phosphatase
LLLCADPAIQVRNFGKVNQRLYRGGQPTLEGLKDLAAMHVALDIDLREPGEGVETERREAESLGLKYLNIPLSGFSAPNPDQIKRVLSIIVPDDSVPTFVHCRRGKDRTGTVIACYRIEHDGWTPQKALAEANRYGMSWMERGMRGFVLSFKPIDLAHASALQP